MATEEKWRRKPEERKIWRPEVIWLVKHQIDIKGQEIEIVLDSFS